VGHAVPFHKEVRVGDFVCWGPERRVKAVTAGVDGGHIIGHSCE